MPSVEVVTWTTSQVNREDTHAVQGFAENACGLQRRGMAARVDLAAAHRLAYMHGFSEGIFNHLTLVVPARATATTRSRSGCTGAR